MHGPARPLLKALTGDPEFEALFSDVEDIRMILSFETALAEAEADAGLVPAGSAAAIASACKSFAPDWDGLAAGIRRDGVLVPELVRQLRAALGEQHGPHLHFGATSQDAIDTSLVLRLAVAVRMLEERLVSLQKTLDGIAATSGDLKLMGRTRGQRALPITVKDKLRAWNEPLGRHRESLAQARRRLLVIQLGGPVGDRQSFGGKGDEVAKRIAARLDLGLAEPWHSQRDPLVEFGSLLSLLTGSLGKIGADVLVMAQNEVGEVTLAGGGGSSAMPHKSNPVNAELLVTLARFNAGLTGTLHQALVHENERDGAAWTLEGLVLPQMVVTAGASLRIAGALAGQLRFQSRPV